MITQTDIESINRYRDRLGEELHAHLVELWEISLSEKGSGVCPDDGEVASSARLAEDAEKGESGDCPKCGHAAEMGILLDSGTDGKGSARQLWCAYCEEVWRFDRIRCTRCGTRSQDALSYHFDEADNARRIYFCEKCEGTQKVLCEKGLRNPSEVDLRLESILMTDLEQAVREHCTQKRVAKTN